MAKPIQLQPGQINPQAQPVSTFVQPGRKDTIKAAKPDLLPQVGQISTVGTNGVGNVAGENSFQRLASDLKNFNPQLMKAAETAGLQYVDWRMDVGEAQAMEEVQRGLAQIDEQAEVSQNARAADNRRVSAIDPQAGWLMRTLDPYQQMGYERGKVKMAGQQVQLGLPSYVQQMSGQIDPSTGQPYVDYSAPDMGMSGVQKLQAQYQLELEAKFGIGSSSPGYQKYFAPNLLRAQSRVSEQVLDDRTTYFESQIKPQAITTTQNALATASTRLETIVRTDGSQVPYMIVMPDGTASVNPEWIRGRAWQVSQAFKDTIARAPLGMSAEISQELYEKLAAQYPEGSLQRRILNAMTGPDGKSFSDRFGYLSRDASLTYTKDQAQLQTNSDKLLDRQYEDVLRIQLNGGMPANAAADAAIESINIGRQNTGQPPLSAAQEARLRANGVRQLDEISPQAAGVGQGQTVPTDPRAATVLLRRLESQDPFEIDVPTAQAELRAIAPYVTKEYQADLEKVSARLDQARTAQKERSEWVPKYGSTLTKRIDTLLGVDELDLYGTDLSNATDLITAEVQSQMTDKLQSLRSEQQEPLTQTQVDQAFREVWMPFQKQVLDGEFKVPGYMDEASSNNAGPKPLAAEPGQPVLTGYNLNQLDSMPRRSVSLRNYRDTQQGPVLSADALINVIQAAASGQKENPAFTKAWRQAKAPNAWAFIQSQLVFYPRLGNGKGWSNEDLQRAKQDLLSFAVRDANRYATTQMLEYSPALARLSNWANEIA